MRYGLALSAAAAVAAIALGTMFSEAGFSTAFGYLQHANPYPEAGRLVVLSEVTPIAGPLRGSLGASIRAVARWQQLPRPGCLRTIGWSRPLGTGLIPLPGAAVAVEVAAVSSNLFPELRAGFLLGGAPGPVSDAGRGALQVIVSHRFWAEHLGSDPGVIGRPIHVLGFDRTIVGVLGSHFVFPADLDLGVSSGQLPGTTDLYIPWALGLPPPGVHGDFGLLALGEIRDGCTLHQLTAELSTPEQAMSAEFPEFAPLTVRVQRISDALLKPLRPELAGLGWGALVVFLVVAMSFCAYVFANAAIAQSDLAVRAALGGNSTRLCAAALKGILPIAISGYGLGLFGAALLLRLMPLGSLLNVAGLIYRPTPNWVIAGVLLACLVVPVLLTASVSVARARRTPIRDLTGARAARPALPRAAWIVLAGQTAVSVVLMSIALLQLATVRRESTTNLGFQPNDVGYVFIDGLGSGPARGKLVARLFTFIRSKAGVRDVAMASGLPLAGYGRLAPVTNELGHRDSAYRFVSASYFRLLGISPVRGNIFTDGDSRTAVISAATARLSWPGEDPLGREFHAGTSQDPLTQVVGIVADVAEAGLRLGATPMVYEPYLSGPPRKSVLLVKTSLAPEMLQRFAREALGGVGAHVAVMSAGNLDDIVAAARQPSRLLLGVTAGAALSSLLACLLGLFALLRTWAGAHSADAAIRSALGATPLALLRLLAKQSLGPMSLGVVLGEILLPAAIHVASAALWVPHALYAICGVLAAFSVVLLALGISLAAGRNVYRPDIGTLLRP